MAGSIVRDQACGQPVKAYRNTALCISISRSIYLSIYLSHSCEREASEQRRPNEARPGRAAGAMAARPHGACLPCREGPLRALAL